jgi:hypothetical protein
MEKDSAEDRLSQLLKGAFAAPATPLKAIPKENGEDRSVKKAAAQTSRRPKS